MATDAQAARLERAIEQLHPAEARLVHATRRRDVHAPRIAAAARFIDQQTRNGAVATPRAIANHLGVAPSAVTKLLARMTRLGVIETTRTSADRRRKVVHVVAEDLPHDDARIEMIREAFVSTEPSRRSIVSPSLQRIVAPIDRQSGR